MPETPVRDVMLTTIKQTSLLRVLEA